MPTSAADVAHLLRRAHFGGSRSEIDQLTALDLPALVDRVLSTTGAPADRPPPALGNAAIEEWRQIDAIRMWWLDRMATSPTPIIEKMTLFWHGHFTTSADKTFEAPWLYEQNAFYRANALGNLQTLAQGMAVQPAMLHYLDNHQNNRWRPNLNFGRELLELFLLGVGNYTEDDVLASSRAWTGHGIDWDTDRYVFRPNWHDNDPKTFRGVTGNHDGPDIIRIILTDPQLRLICAKFICRKLWEFFAHPTPPTGVVDALADTMVANDFELRPVLRALFLRSEFYAPAAKLGHVRTPIEYVVAVMRAMGADAATLHPEWYLRDLGQEPLNPPDVSGWKHNGYWLSTATASVKAEFANYVTWRLRELGRHPFAGSSQLTPDALVQRAFDLFGIVTPSEATRAALRAWIVQLRSIPYQEWAEMPSFLLLVLLTPDVQLG